jgi:hypothetical protein
MKLKILYKTLIFSMGCVSMATGGELKFISEFDPFCEAAGEWFVRTIRLNWEPALVKSYRMQMEKFAPAKQRAVEAGVYHRLLCGTVPELASEDAQIEENLGWATGDFTFFNNTFYRKPGCTTWMVMPDVSAYGSAMLHKNRDYTGQFHLTVRLCRTAPGRYRTFSAGDLWNTGSGCAINEKGLMIAQNDGENTLDQSSVPVTVGSAMLTRFVAEQCATVDEAVAMLRKFYTQGIMRDNDIYSIADRNGGAIVEATPRRLAEARLTSGFEVRANNFLLPGMRSSGGRTRSALLNGDNRRYEACEGLFTALGVNGKITARDMWAIARQRNTEDEQKGLRQVCGPTTLYGMTLLADCDYPEVLSVVFVALGPPRHTVFLPIPMAANTLPEKLISGSWGARSFALRERLAQEHEQLLDIERLEQRLLDDFLTARESARRLLHAGYRADAVALLNTVFREQAVMVDDFLSRLAAF